MKNTILTTKRLRLRTWLASDAAPYHKHCNTPEVMHFLGGVVSLRQVRAEIRWFQQHQRRYGHTFWVVERKRDKAFLGFCGIIRIHDTDTPMYGALEIGWRIRADKWRRGYAFEAASAVLDWAEPRASGEHIVARIDKGNVASRNLARKLFMRRDKQRERAEARVDDSVNVFKNPARRDVEKGP